MAKCLTKIESTKKNINFLKTCIWEFIFFEVLMCGVTGLMLALSLQYAEQPPACLFLMLCVIVSGTAIKLSHDERNRMEGEVEQLQKILDRLMLLHKIEEQK